MYMSMTIPQNEPQIQMGLVRDWLDEVVQIRFAFVD